MNGGDDTSAASDGIGKTLGKKGARAALIAAYREGAAFAAVEVISGAAGIRLAVTTGDGELRLGESIAARWWCRRTVEAECIVAAVERARRRSRTKIPDAIADACNLVLRAAQRLEIPLRSDEDVVEEAMHVIVRVDDEIERQQQSGELKSVNQAYRQYRLEASARGERVLRYAEWIERYKARLVREIAVTLRRS